MMVEGPFVELGAGLYWDSDPELLGIQPGRPLRQLGARGVQVADHFIRGHRSLGRFSHAPAVIGIPVAATDEARTLQIHVQLDDTALSWWRERVAGIGTQGLERMARDPLSEQLADFRDASWYEAEFDRVVRFEVVGAEDQHVLLARSGRTGGTISRAVGTFDLEAGHLGDGGLLLIRVTDPAVGLRTELGTTRAAAVGLELIDVQMKRPSEIQTIGASSRTIDAGTAERAGYISTGGNPGGGSAGLRPVTGGAVLLSARRPTGFQALALSCTEENGRRHRLAEERSSLQTVALDGGTLPSAPLEPYENGILVHPPPGACAIIMPEADGGAVPLQVVVRGLVVEADSPHRPVPPAPIAEERLTFTEGIRRVVHKFKQ